MMQLFFSSSKILVFGPQLNGQRERSTVTAYHLIESCGLVAARHMISRRMVDSHAFIHTSLLAISFTAFSFSFHAFSELNRANDANYASEKILSFNFKLISSSLGAPGWLSRLSI